MEDNIKSWITEVAEESKRKENRKMAMTTKEQERKALAAIRKIVDGLGDDSYIVAAFDGVWKTAESNIDNDWVCSAVEDARIAGIGEGREEYGQKVANLEKTVKGLTLKLELERANADTHKKAAEYKKSSQVQAKKRKRRSKT
jgi:hypothetical protein